MDPQSGRPRIMPTRQAMVAAANDKDATACRYELARLCSKQLHETGTELHLIGHFIGPDRAGYLSIWAWKRRPGTTRQPGVHLSKYIRLISLKRRGKSKSSVLKPRSKQANFIPCCDDHLGPFTSGSCSYLAESKALNKSGALSSLSRCHSRVAKSRAMTYHKQTARTGNARRFAQPHVAVYFNENNILPDPSGSFGKITLHPKPNLSGSFGRIHSARNLNQTAAPATLSLYVSPLRRPASPSPSSGDHHAAGPDFQESLIRFSKSNERTPAAVTGGLFYCRRTLVRAI